MSKRRHERGDEVPAKRYRQTGFQSPFGFNALSYLNLVSKPGPIGPYTHMLSNTIIKVVNNKLQFSKPEKVFEVEELQGLYVKLKGVAARVEKSYCHTPHTASIYKLAHELLRILHCRPRIRMIKNACANHLEVDMRSAVSTTRGSSENRVWLRAKHQGQKVVLKTTTKIETMLRYVIEAVIHEIIMRRSPSYVPALKFIAFAQTADGERDCLVLCSEQLERKSVNAWIWSLHSLHPRANINIKLWNMLRQVCICLRNLQKYAHFTHRDCHSNNVYYDENCKPDHVKFIDFDWSSIMYGGHTLSVPRHLFDTSRPYYAKNRSVDLCIFLRTIGPTLRTPLSLKKKVSFTRKDMTSMNKWNIFEERSALFFEKIWKPIMTRYERESEKILKARASTSKEAMQLLKMNVGPKGEFSHGHGLVNLSKRNPKSVNEFDYRMGYFEWPSMTPDAIITFLEQQRKNMLSTRLR